MSQQVRVRRITVNLASWGIDQGLVAEVVHQRVVLGAEHARTRNAGERDYMGIV
jgi:hypothetical protein